MHLSHLSLIFLLTAGVLSRRVPPNLRAFYNSVKSGGCTGSDRLQGGFQDEEDGPKNFSYCRHRLGSGNGSAIYISSPSGLANMDIDCDGASSRHDGNSRCGSSADTQSETRWKSYVNKYSDGKADDVDANIVPYVVLGNEGSYNPTFDPRKYGVQPLSVVAVVCGEKLVYGVWADTNGDDGPPLVGEASIALATECFGDGITGDNGYDGRDVLYVAFEGEDAVPRKEAAWSAKTFDAFEESIAGVGDSLVGRLR